jgi:hypothetical protein
MQEAATNSIPKIGLIKTDGVCSNV